MRKQILSILGSGLLTFGAVTLAEATTINIPLDIGSWTTYSAQYGGAGGSSTETVNGIQFNGNGYRDGVVALSTNSHNFQNANVNIKWMVSGGTYNQYASFNIGIGHYDSSADKPLALTSAGFLTTNHSYSGSTVISANTWYYTTISIFANHSVTSNTSIGDYLDNGGSLFTSRTHAINEQNWSLLSSAGIQADFNDNYGGTSTWITLGEVTMEDNAPVPEPATMLLFGTGLAALAGARIRKKKCNKV